MKKIIGLALSLLIITGCNISKIKDDSFDNIINTVLYKDTNLFNISRDGYKFYLPRGNTVTDVNEYNLVIKDKENIYYLYISPIEYYYKTLVDHKIDSNIFYSKNLNNNNKTGYVDITKIDDKYFVEVIYNYGKIESYVEESDLNNSFFSMCSILSTIKFNDSAINYKLSNHEFDSTTEEFSIFKSKKQEDNFLKYVEDYDKYNDQKKNKKDSDIIETSEGE